MIRAVVFAVVLILGFLLWNAPASLVRDALAQTSGVDLVEVRGTLWNGQGQLITQGRPLGQLSWAIQPARLLTLDLAYDMTLLDANLDLAGELVANPSQVVADVRGRVTNAALNQLLAPYQITLAGDVAVEKLLIQAGSQLEQLDGTLRWQGGTVSYPEATGMQMATLPPLVAVLAEEQGHATANVFEAGQSTPLLVARTLDGGAYRLGITKRLTELVGRPWRGSDPDHAVVLELEEQFP